MSAIPKEFINDLLSRVDIVDIVGLRIKLKKTGSNYATTCPFHSEKTPSFTVSQTKQFFHCFGCGAHGNAISFLMQYENLEFISAIESLANYAGIDVPKTKTQNDTADYRELYTLMSEISNNYQKELRQTPAAINYLKKRGFTGKICKYFSIGYATNDWNNLKNIIKNQDSRKKQLLTAGMLIQKENQQKFYARFRHRIMIPIKDRHGNIIAFGGRSLDNDSPPKYLNSPETPIFHKRNELFGLYEVKKTNKNIEQIIVVEGYLDVISLAQYEITNAVASLGTALTTNQIQSLLRVTTNILFCFDGDNAGKTAASRALENILPLMREGMRVSFLFLPENEDPDSLIRKIGKKEFLELARNALPLSDFFFKKILATKDTQNMEDRAEIAKIAQESLQKMPNGIYKQLLLEKLSELIKIDITNTTQFDLSQKNHLKNTSTIAIIDHKNPVLMAITLLLFNPDLAQLIENKEKIEKSKAPHINLLIQLINLSKSQHNLTVGAILEYYRNSSDLDLLNKLLQWEPILSPNDLKNEFLDVLNLIEKYDIEQTIQQLLNKSATNSLTNEEKLQLQKLIAKTKL